MARLLLRSSCPVCQCPRFVPVRQPWWTVFLPLLRLYRCSYCYIRVLTYPRK